MYLWIKLYAAFVVTVQQQTWSPHSSPSVICSRFSFNRPRITTLARTM